MLPRAFGEAVVERQRHDIEAEVGRTLHVGVAAEDVGARAELADIACRQQGDAERAHVGRADRVLGRAHAPDQRRGLLGREHLGDALELRARHAGHALDLLRRPLVDLLADVVHAVDALGDELLVLPAVLEDVPEHAPDHGDVRARADADVLGGVRCRARQPRIDHDHVGAVELLAFEHVLQRHRMRFRRIAAHDDHGLGVADVVVAVRHRAVAPGVGYAGDRGRMADARLVVGIVRAPEGGELAIEIGGLVGEFRRAEPIDGIGARLLADRHQLVADLVDRRIPRDALPLPADHLHRVAQAAIAVRQLARGGALGAMRAAIDGAVPAGLLPDPHAVLDLGQHRAADRAVRAHVLADDALGRRRTGAGGFGLAHAAQRQRAERGQPAGRKAGAAQEGAAIHAAAGLICKCRSKRAATCLTFAFLDQHGLASLSAWLDIC